MGFFSKSNKLESYLVSTYTSMYESTGLSKKDAFELASSLMKRAKEESIKAGMLELGPGYGDTLLKSNDEKTKRKLSLKRSEGVTDKDIRSWWNLHDLERRMMFAQEENTKMTLFIHKVKEQLALGVDEESAYKHAGAVTKKFHPYFGVPDESDTSPDRDLPQELKDRVNVYIQSRMNDSVQYKKDIETSSSFNALVRREIRKGRL